MDWPEVVRRISNGEDAEAVLDQRELEETADFVAYLQQMGRPDLAEHHLARMREIDTGVWGAKAAWHSISAAQKKALILACKVQRLILRDGGALVYDTEHEQAGIRYATVKNLCQRDLLAWDGGAFRPSDAVVATERGRFVLKHGES